MSKFLFGIFVITSTFGVAGWSAAQDSGQVNGGPAFTEATPRNTLPQISANREKARSGGYQNVADTPRSALASMPATDSINPPKESILGMDPTIALFVVFGVFLVLVVVIVASSRGNRSHD